MHATRTLQFAKAALMLLIVSSTSVLKAQLPPQRTTGIERCDNARVVPARPRLPSYRIATGEVVLPLVFAPGLGWYHVRLDPAGAGLYRLRDALPTCEDHPTPATYVAASGVVRIPEIEAVDEGGVVQAKYDATLKLDNNRGVFVVGSVWPWRPTALSLNALQPPPARKRALADALVRGVQLTSPPDPYTPGDRLPLTRITGGRIGAPEPGCPLEHLHGTINIDGGAPIADPNPGGCGHGVIVMVEPTIATSVVNVVPVAGTCGPDITDVFINRLRKMAQRLNALPSAEKGTFDGTMFLARNGGNIDFEASPIRAPNVAPVCPTLPCTGKGLTSTVTLCGRCVVTHVDNDIQYGFVSQALGVPEGVQMAGATGWDLFQRGSIDPPASQAAYILGNAIWKMLAARPNMTGADLCAAMPTVTYRTLTFTDVPVMDIFTEGLADFGFERCQPCVHRCPDILVFKDFERASWQLDSGAQPPPP